MAYIYANSVFFIAHWADGHWFFFPANIGRIIWGETTGRRVGVSVAVTFQASCAGKSSAGLPGGWEDGFRITFFLGNGGDSVGRCWEIRISVNFSQFQSISVNVMMVPFKVERLPVGDLQ